MTVKRSDTPGVRHEEASEDAKTSHYTEICPRCGQSFDNRVLHQVIYHDQATHVPIDLTLGVSPAGST